MKLSLTVITGNAEQYIGRFLDHFQHLADEIVVVRACGDQDPDNTLRIAQDRGCIIGEYFNQEGTGHWPHVDNFAAARNKAASLATGDWLAWADTDDIISKESCQGMREMLAQLADDIDIVLCPYEVPDDGITHNRERFWRRGRAKWKNAIHECLEVEKTQKAARFDNVAVVHMPIGPRKPENNERNLRILEQVPLAERTASQLFYTMQAQRSCGNIEGAIESAQALAAAEDAGLPERYEAFIFLGQLAPDPTTRAQLYLQAVAVDPSRREAYGELCLLSLASNRFDQALAWSDAMWGLKKPRHWYWNSRRKFHSWLGVQLRGMALRGAGRPEEASALELNHFIENGAKISLLHATRGRPKQAWLARQTWLDKAKNADAIEHIFAIDYDDEKAGPFICCRHVQNRVAGPVGAWNEAAKASNGQILVQMSDDFDPPMYWDEMILEAIGDTSKPKVLAVSDGNRKDDLLCMAILTRARYEQQGHLFHPEFFSMYSDNWFSEQAFKDGVLIDARDKITFQHNHPAFGKGEMDETYSRSNSQDNYHRGECTLKRLQQGVITASDVEGWCDYRAFYHAVAKALPDGGKFVEIGSWMGQSIIVLAQEIQNLGKSIKLYCVDTWKGEQNQAAHVDIVESHGGSILHVFKQNIEAAGVADMITIVEGDSAEMASEFIDGEIDGVYIDAAHDYDSVTKDLAAWFPKIKETGIFSGHDYPWHEVSKAVHEHADANGYDVQGINRVWLKINKP